MLSRLTSRLTLDEWPRETRARFASGFALPVPCGDGRVMRRALMLVEPTSPFNLMGWKIGYSPLEDGGGWSSGWLGESDESGPLSGDMMGTR